MAIDFIARAAAAKASGANVAPASTFAALGAKSLDPAIGSFVSSGYTTPGKGPATYISDATATAGLAALYPRCCKADANGRYWRLVADGYGPVSFRAVGVVTGTGTNNFPALQQLFDYAAAVGLLRLELPHGNVEVWQSVRTSGVNVIAKDGTLTATSSLIITSEGRTTLNFKGPTGGDPNADYQTIGGYGPFRGGGLCLFGDQYPYPADPNDWTIQFFEMSNVRLKGNRTVGRGVSLPDEKDKGFWHANAARNITLRDCEIDHFCYELLYGGNYTAPVGTYLLERVKAHHSGQSCLNFTFAANVRDIDGEYGDSYIAAELFGANYNFTRTRFYNCDAAGFSSSKSTATLDPSNYAHPANSPPLFITTLDSVVCDRVLAVHVHAHVYGDINIIDGYLHTGAFAGDIDLKATVTCDRLGGLTACILEGPAAVPAGIYADTALRNVNIELTAVVTRYGRSVNNRFGSIYGIQGYMDPESVKLHIRHAGPRTEFWGYQEPPKVMPFVTTDFAYAQDGNTGVVPGRNLYIAAAYALYPPDTGINAYAGAAAIPITFISLGTGATAYEGVPHGQRFKFFAAQAAGGNSFTFAHNGTNMALSGDLVLNKDGSWIEFEYNGKLGKWTDVARFNPL